MAHKKASSAGRTLRSCHTSAKAKHRAAKQLGKLGGRATKRKR